MFMCLIFVNIPEIMTFNVLHLDASWPVDKIVFVIFFYILHNKMHNWIVIVQEYSLHLDVIIIMQIDGVKKKANKIIQS